MRHEVTVTFKDPPDAVFTFLADPRNRPLWQSSLKAVELAPGDHDAAPYVGMTWRDLTAVGVKPTMSITRMTPYRIWAESGVWKGISVDLTLQFTAVATGTRVIAVADLQATGMWRLVSGVVGRLAPAALTSDLRKAGEVIRESRAAG